MHYTSLLDSQSVAADMWSSQLLTGRPVRRTESALSQGYGCLLALCLCGAVMMRMCTPQPAWFPECSR